MFWKASHQFLRIQANRFLMTTTENVSDVPEYANVKIGNNCFELSFDSLVASMTHQYLSNSSNYHHNEDYDIFVRDDYYGKWRKYNDDALTNKAADNILKFSLKQKQFIDTAIGLPLLLLNKMLIL